MIFIKNPIAGKVKTRLGKDIGHDEAVKYYIRLLELTRNVAKEMNVDRWVWYGDFINDEDEWNESHFKRKLQHGASLGDRMRNAFEEAFDAGYEKVAIIGSDCPDMSPNILQRAYAGLVKKDAVLGPANDGGYYLLGMKQLLPVFSEVEWSTETVLEQTIDHLKNHNLSYSLLPELADLDTVEDLKLFPNL